MKKMRKLIPAFAMLMVAAIMMTTASFAWFTMSDTVTATGMQVQAKADGTLVIKADQKLTLADSLAEAKFNSKGTTNLTPITYRKGVEGSADGWYYCNNTKTVDSVTGKPADGTVVKADTMTPLAGGYVDYVVYIASAGDVVRNKQITATVTDGSDVKQTVAPAYTVAFYYGEKTIDATTVPDAIINVKDGATPVVISGTDAVEIPSTVGITEATNAVGLKVTMRVYVDGELVGATKKVPVAKYTAVTSGTYDKDVTYYVANGDSYTVAPTNGLEDDVTDISTMGFYTCAYELEDTEAYYVNNADAPTAPTGLVVTFKAIEYVDPNA